ncbi:MAG: DUF2779 domain-containing protein [Helicobacteraceae bacterium]|nr:DUF2779 domain-containing protein [Helicobacteraceae bacterium]
MDASALFRLLSCAKARYLYSQNIAPRETPKREPIVAPHILRQIWRRFRSDLSHPLSFKTASYKNLSVFVDRVTQNQNGFELAKPLFTSEPYVAATNELALAVWILERRGLKIDKVFVYYVNKEYLKEGDLDFDKLFIKRDATKEVYGRYLRVGRNLIDDANKSVLCDLDFACQYADICFSNAAGYSIFNIASLPKELKVALYRQNVIDPRDIPEYLLTDYQKIQIECDKTKKTHIDLAALTSFVVSVTYPIYFLDFEAINYVVPIFDKLKPFGALPFQFSLHTLSSPRSRAKHYEFIADCEIDGRLQIAKTLCELIGDKGSVAAYGAQLERSTLKDLAELFPQYRAKLLNIRARIVDLSLPFEKRWYYNHRMCGSIALKAVAPMMIRGVSYDDGIKNGEEAMRSYLSMHSANGEDKERIRRDLLNYCKKDSEYLVGIYRKLVTLTKSK